MKTLKCLSLLSLSIIALTGCGGGGGGGGDDPSKRSLTIEFVKGGFGLTPYEKLVEAFEKEHPDVKVKLVPNREMASTTLTRITNGTASDVMIYNRTVNNIRLWAKQGLVYDMTDLFQQEVESGVKLIDMLDENGINDASFEGKYWCVPEYMNMNGFVYNASLFEAKGWEVPTTTKEFEDLCENISNETAAGQKIYPIVFCQDADGYLYYGEKGWRANYEGFDNLEAFTEFDSVEVYNPDNNEGKLKGLETLKKYFFDGNYAIPGSTTMGATEAQSKLFTYEAAMMLNGSWFENEMSAYQTEGSPTFKMFKIPEISNNQNEILHADGYTTKDGKSIVNAEIVANVFIPKCAKNLDDAKEWIKFTSRKDICELWTKYSNAVRPFNYNYSSSNPAYSDMSAFGKSVLDMANDNAIYIEDSKAPVSVIGKATYYVQGYWFWKFGAYSPSTCVQSDYTVASEYWSTWVKEAEEIFGKQ